VKAPTKLITTATSSLALGPEDAVSSTGIACAAPITSTKNDKAIHLNTYSDIVCQKQASAGPCSKEPKELPYGILKAPKYTGRSDGGYAEKPLVSYWPIVAPNRPFAEELPTHPVRPVRESPPLNFASLTVTPRAGGFWHLKSHGCSAAKCSLSAVRGIGAKTEIIASIRHKQHQRRTTMPAIRVYGIKNCDTMKKAMNWLSDNGVAYEFIDYKKAGVAEANLPDWAARAGWEKLLNTRGLMWKKLSDVERADVDEAKALVLMAQYPALIKRPVLDSGSQLLVGFSPENYAEKLK
jgi:arsenate reductase